MNHNKAVEEIPGRYHTTVLRVPLFDVDLGQAVYHGNYFHLLELGREDFLRTLGHPYRRFMDQQLHLTIVECNCTYRRPLHYDDLITVHTGVAWWRTRSLAFSQLITREEADGDSVLCTQATLNMVCVRFTGQPTHLPEVFVELLKVWSSQNKPA